MQLRGIDVPDQPDQTFSGSVLLGLQLVQHKGLESLGLSGSGQLTIADFLRGGLGHVDSSRRADVTNLDVAKQVTLDRVESDGAEHVCGCHD